MPFLHPVYLASSYLVRHSGSLVRKGEGLAGSRGTYRSGTGEGSRGTEERDMVVDAH